MTSSSVYLAGDGEIEKYQIEEDGSGIEFAAHGTFEGRLSNAYSINEYEGNLRLATYCLACSPGIPSNVVVMQQSGQSLETVGEIRNVASEALVTRFAGERAYATSLSVDAPLYVIDLSDPMNPTIQGELTLPGYSRIVHAMDDGHILGVGRNESFWNESSQLQISLFNVADPSNPIIVDQYEFEGGISTTSPFNAFNSTYQPAMLNDHNLLSLPVHSSHYSQDAEKLFEGEASAVVVFDIDVAEGAIKPLGQVDFADRALRSLAEDDHLVSISRDTVKMTPIRQPDDVITTVTLPDVGSVRVRSLPFVDGPTLDINQDGRISPIDALMLVNHSIAHGYGMMDEFTGMDGVDMMDVNKDLAFSPLDTLLVVNGLGGHGTTLNPSMTPGSSGGDSDSVKPPSSVDVAGGSVANLEHRLAISNIPIEYSGYFFQNDELAAAVDNDEVEDTTSWIDGYFASPLAG